MVDLGFLCDFGAKWVLGWEMNGKVYEKNIWNTGKKIALIGSGLLEL